MTETSREKIAQLLLKSSDFKKEDIDAALSFKKQKKISLDKAMIEKGLISEQDILARLVNEMNIPFINLNKYKIDPALQEIIPERAARQYGIIPISRLEHTVTVVVSDPLNVLIKDDLKNIAGMDIEIAMSSCQDIQKAIDNYYGIKDVASVKEISKDIQMDDFEIVIDKEGSEEDDDIIDESEKSPIIRMVNLVIKEALKKKASDIHIEPTGEGMRVRYRIDGILHDILNIPKANQNAVIVRIKIMSRLDITVNQIPQDGRFKLKFSSKEVDFRVSLLPTIFGQKIVMRILDKGSLSVGLNGLGFSEKALELLREGIKKPFGMILVTGPTGSGKSTTLYSIINKLNMVDKNIVTIEDPVEYLIDGLTQIHARPEIGLTFAEGLRSVLRQSPDIVMVGEIRDNETADIAIKASLTGQLVFSTLHTNDAAGALTRLVDMEVEPFLVSSSLVLVSAQRLCRKICTHCKEPADISGEMLDQLSGEIGHGAVFYQGKGCEFCSHTGYSGRIGITEIMEMDDIIRDMLLKGKSSDEIKQYAIEKKGMNTLREDAVAKGIEGITTVEEIFRVTSTE